MFGKLTFLFQNILFELFVGGNTMQCMSAPANARMLHYNTKHNGVAGFLPSFLRRIEWLSKSLQCKDVGPFNSSIPSAHKLIVLKENALVDNLHTRRQKPSRKLYETANNMTHNKAGNRKWIILAHIL